MLMVGGIWLVCSLAALLLVIPLCRMAKQGDSTRIIPEDPAGHAHAAMAAAVADAVRETEAEPAPTEAAAQAQAEAPSVAAAREGEPGFVTAVRSEPARNPGRVSDGAQADARTAGAPAPERPAPTEPA